MNFTKLALLVTSFVLLTASVSAYFYGAYVPETYQSNQVYAGSFYKPSGPYSATGWVYNAYTNNSGYPALGGGRFYPYGYNAGSYPVIAVQSVPTYSYTYGNPYYGAAAYPYAQGYYNNCGYSVCYH